MTFVSSDGHCRLEVVDDGRGFDFTGRYDPEALERMRKGPRVVRERLNVLKMCEDCRVIAVTEQAFDPYGAGIAERPKPRTAEDYLREAEEKGRG